MRIQVDPDPKHWSKDQIVELVTRPFPGSATFSKAVPQIAAFESARFVDGRLPPIISVPPLIIPVPPPIISVPPPIISVPLPIIPVPPPIISVPSPTNSTLSIDKLSALWLFVVVAIRRSGSIPATIFDRLLASVAFGVLALVQAVETRIILGQR